MKRLRLVGAGLRGVYRAEIEMRPSAAPTDPPPPRPWSAVDDRWDRGHPFAWRVWLRALLPAALARLVPKGRDCAARGAWHRWYNQDDIHSACYHCRVVREGRLWEY